MLQVNPLVLAIDRHVQLLERFDSMPEQYLSAGEQLFGPYRPPITHRVKLLRALLHVQPIM
eukprot:2307263-Amphidinium_carterae.1